MQQLYDAEQRNTEALYSIAKERKQTILSGIALILVLLALVLKFTTAVERLNNAIIDVQVSLLAVTELSPLPVIVQVDEKSLAKYGQWPWPRHLVARLLEALQQGGAAVVGVDALFVERDRTSPVEIQRVMKRDFKQPFPLASIKESLRDNDIILGQTLKTGTFVLSYLFLFDNPDTNNTCQPKSASGAMLTAGEQNGAQQLHHAVNIVCNVAPIQDAANYSGFINAAPDNNGIYRKTPLVIRYKDRIYPSLALQTFLTANGLDQFLLSIDQTGLVLKLGKMQVPLDNAGNLLIKFPMPGQGFEKISASDVLSGKTNLSRINNKIIFVGFSAAGLHEFRPTPYAPEFLGVEFHAAIIDNLVRHDFLNRPSYAQALELIVAIVLGLTLFVTLASARPAASVLIPCLLMVLLLMASQLLLVYTGMAISPALPVLMVSLALFALSLMKYISAYLHVKHMQVLVASSQEGIVESFCSISEYRDSETGGHIKRTQNYVKALAQELQKQPKFKQLLSNEVIELLFKAAPLHDIGKIGIRDHILLKPGKLNKDEFEVMKTHTKIGAEIIRSVAEHVNWNIFIQFAFEISLYHQEKWDGSGYPEGLAGEDIPFSARLMALADVYDALISKRVYKPALSHYSAVAIIRKGKDKHFDPLVVEAFEAIHKQFLDIALRFLDTNDQRETLLKDIHKLTFLSRNTY